MNYSIDNTLNATPMSFSTLTNLIQLCVFALLGLSSLVGALFFGAWWHLFTAAGCLVFCIVLYMDDDYGTESVKPYFNRKFSK